jgi:hypothetical protein
MKSFLGTHALVSISLSLSLSLSLCLCLTWSYGLICRCPAASVVFEPNTKQFVYGSTECMPTPNVQFVAIVDR